MAFKFVVFAAFVAVARAGVLPAVASYSSAPSVSYSSISSPVVTKYAAPLQYAAPVQYSAPIAKVAYAPVAKAVYAEPEAPAHYDFGYSVSDPLTGDSKTQQESRSGDAVQGSYSLIDADGFKRTVEYTADEHNGFNAVVHREPLAQKVVSPVAYAAPVAKYAAPAYYH